MSGTDVMQEKKREGWGFSRLSHNKHPMGRKLGVRGGEDEGEVEVVEWEGREEQMIEGWICLVSR